MSLFTQIDYFVDFWMKQQTYIQIPVLHTKSEFHCGSDKWREIYQNEPLRTECCVFHRLLVALQMKMANVSSLLVSI